MSPTHASRETDARAWRDQGRRPTRKDQYEAVEATVPRAAGAGATLGEEYPQA
ncbi:hypothetical protein [Streptantibioticus cattleyicolor]|uniref:Uncharacterized protein n=1 Tax=Streptantibioticus cattleyicolor (strain ATCC 35852 / DSM 46488 / JCM 4925 / NBRC 14057 / NRRL 8057) TaxID=1003195 RepID=G8XDX4_STREN|nr:hypothetical protein [Streptantibioticus cattleyicolor]AEW99209.1 hypothetical protein SCATT_p10160 [Streptantibioticus cattleyicolor NRRL 8057 = DSM 46488]